MARCVLPQKNLFTKIGLRLDSMFCVLPTPDVHEFFFKEYLPCPFHLSNNKKFFRKKNILFIPPLHLTTCL
jgi:hypothetical protein